MNVKITDIQHFSLHDGNGLEQKFFFLNVVI